MRGEALGEHEETESGKPAAGLVSSPRGYFGRASRAAIGPARAAVAEPAPSRRPAAYRAGDPAVRVFGTIEMPFAPLTPLTGAVATLSGIADGEHEKLMVELGTTLVRATHARDEAAGTYSLTLNRTQSAEVYRALLGSVRYVNDAAELHTGPRRVVLQAVDAAGTMAEIATATIAVGDMPVETAPAAEEPSPTVDRAGAAAADETPAALGDRTAPPIGAPVLDRRVVLGETMRFNSDGDFTLFWWPRLLANGRARRVRFAEPATEAATPPGSFFSQGGRTYRVFDPESDAPPPQRHAATAAQAARESAAPETAANAASEAQPDAGAGIPANDVWMPGRGLPPPGFEAPPPLRLEDVFGSDMENALVRRLIEQRIAARA